MLSRIKSVSYTLPTPLSSRAVSGADANHAFCYRETGTLPLQGSSGNGAPVLALAVVDLGAGQKFQISAPAGTTQPPDCAAHQAGPASSASTSPGQGQLPSLSPRPSGSPSTSPTTTLTEVPNVVGVPASSAVTLLQNDGFSVTQQTAAGPPGTSPGTVWQQRPGPAQGPLKQGSMVTIFVQPQQQPTSSPTST